MGAKLANATTRPGSGNGWFRARIKKKFLENAQGKFLRFDFPAISGEDAFPVNVKVGSHVTFSVGSRNPDVIEERLAFATAQLKKFLRQIQAGELALDDSIIQSYARSVYDFSLREYSDKTGLPSMQKTHAAYMNIEHKRTVKLDSIWKQWPHQCGEFDISNELHPISFDTGDFSYEAMNYRVGLLINWWLKENDIEITSLERTRLVRATDIYARQIVEGSTIQVSSSHVQANAKARTGQPATKIWTLNEVFDHWAENVAKRKKTVAVWRNVLNELIKFLKHEIASDVTQDNLIKWRKHLIESGRAINTINGMDLTATKRIFSHAHLLKAIPENPATVLKPVEDAKTLPDRSPYSNEDVVTIINAARTNTDPHLRWIPQLTASVGSRVGEISQIHASQVKQDIDNPEIWTIEINKSVIGQTVKTRTSKRTVPLHPDLFGKDFLDFVATRRGKFLFTDKKFSPQAKSKFSDYIDNKVRLWIKTLKIDFTNKGPTHSFRHWFTDRAARKVSDADLIELIQGHSRRNSRRMYRTKILQEDRLNAIKAVFAELPIDGIGTS